MDQVFTYSKIANRRRQTEKIAFLEKRKPFLELLLESARQGVNLTDEDILSQVDTFMFEVRPVAIPSELELEV